MIIEYAVLVTGSRQHLFPSIIIIIIRHLLITTVVTPHHGSLTGLLHRLLPWQHLRHQHRSRRRRRRHVGLLCRTSRSLWTLLCCLWRKCGRKWLKNVHWRSRLRLTRFSAARWLVGRLVQLPLDLIIQIFAYPSVPQMPICSWFCSRIWKFQNHHKI